MKRKQAITCRTGNQSEIQDDHQWRIALTHNSLEDTYEQLLYENFRRRSEMEDIGSRNLTLILYLEPLYILELNMVREFFQRSFTMFYLSSFSW